MLLEIFFCNCFGEVGKSSETLLFGLVNINLILEFSACHR